jgi:hypothetical protein
MCPIKKIPKYAVDTLKMCQSDLFPNIYIIKKCYVSYQ